MGRTLQRRGFSLIEAAVAIIIVAAAAVAVMELMAAGTRTNSLSHRMATGQNLAASLQEATLNWTGAQLTSANNRVYSPPVNALGDRLNDLSQWSQTLQVQPVNPSNLNSTVATSKTLRVTAQAKFQSEPVCSIQWLVLVP